MDVPLQQLARVKIDEKLLSSKPLTLKQKKALRERAILALVASKSYGERLTLAEVSKVAHYKFESQASMLLKDMIAEGKLERHDIGASTAWNGFFCTLPGKVKIIRPADTPPIANLPSMIGAFTIDDIEKKAAMYAWTNTVEGVDNPALNLHSDLRNFIKYLRTND